MRVQAQGGIEDPLSHGFGLTRFVSSQTRYRGDLLLLIKADEKRLRVRCVAVGATEMACPCGDADDTGRVGHCNLLTSQRA